MRRSGLKLVKLSMLRSCMYGYLKHTYPHCSCILRSTFHGGDGHPKEHITVEFQDANGDHVATHHVRGPNNVQDKKPPEVSQLICFKLPSDIVISVVLTLKIVMSM